MRRTDPTYTNFSFGALKQASEDFGLAHTPEEIRAVFKKHYRVVGWRRLGQLFALNYGYEEIWLKEQDRVERRLRSEHDN